MAIPIENIYYLLCYAWNKLDERDRVAVSVEDCRTLPDLFAKILINSTRILLKRGIDRNYVDVTAAIAGVKGKIEFGETLKAQLLPKGKTICSFDEFSSDILTNRVLVATLFRLMRVAGLDRDLKEGVKSLIPRFGPVTPVELGHRVFDAVRYHRNNKFYEFVIGVCRLIYENTLLSEALGDYSFTDFTRDEGKMNRLFEEFLRNFYRLEQSEYSVGRESIYWRFESSDEDKALLPRMETDVTLIGASRKIFIDAKYYRESLSSRFETPKVHSGNLFQMYCYLRNQIDSDDRTRSATGILLYPRVDRDLDLSYSFDGMRLLVKTVDLAASWREIESRLLGLVGV